MLICATSDAIPLLKEYYGTVLQREPDNLIAIIPSIFASQLLESLSSFLFLLPR